MKKYIVLTVIVVVVFSPSVVSAAEIAKLPYAAGEQFVVSNGYWTPPMHIKKDGYALDFTQNKCDAYGKYVLAVISGTVSLVAESGYNGGYGTEVLVRDTRGTIERYAHMIPGSVPIGEGDAISQGTIIGEIGNTGLVTGTDCVAHPGAHIHFASYAENTTKIFTAYNSEPISGYINFKEGGWYRSDNMLAATKGNLAALVEILGSFLNGKNIFITPSRSGSVIASSTTETGVDKEAERSASPSRSEIPISIPEQVGPSVSLNTAIAPLVLPLQLQSTTASTSVSTSSVYELFPGPSGGVSVAEPIVSVTSTSVSAPNVRLDDPSDDTVPACK